jgi:hypothetical protein
LESETLNDKLIDRFLKLTEFLPLIHSIPIELYKNKEQYGKTPKSGAAITKERQWYSYGGQEPNNHPDIHGKMDKKYPCNAISVHPTEIIFLLF